MSIEGVSQRSPLAGPPRMEPLNALDMSREIISAKDADGDGALSLKETGLSEANFSALDSDGDSAISENELVSKLTEKLEAMKEKMDSAASRPNGPPPPDGPRPAGPPPQEGTDDTEELTELERLLEMMNAVGDTTPGSGQSDLDMYTQILEAMGSSREEQEDFFELVQNNGIDLLA